MAAKDMALVMDAADGVRRGAAERPLDNEEDRYLLKSCTNVTAREARTELSKIVQSARYGKNRIIITIHGDPAAVVVPISDYKFILQAERSFGERISGGQRISLTKEQLLAEQESLSAACASMATRDTDEK